MIKRTAAALFLCLALTLPAYASGRIQEADEEIQRTADAVQEAPSGSDAAGTAPDAAGSMMPGGMGGGQQQGGFNGTRQQRGEGGEFIPGEAPAGGEGETVQQRPGGRQPGGMGGGMGAAPGGMPGQWEQAGGSSAEMQAEEQGLQKAAAFGITDFLRDYSTPIISVILLGAAFLFVIFYKRKSF